jgi:hypothetical protein
MSLVFDFPGWWHYQRVSSSISVISPLVAEKCVDFEDGSRIAVVKHSQSSPGQIC